MHVSSPPGEKDRKIVSAQTACGVIIHGATNMEDSVHLVLLLHPNTQPPTCLMESRLLPATHCGAPIYGAARKGSRHVLYPLPYSPTPNPCAPSSILSMDTPLHLLTLGILLPVFATTQANLRV